MWLRSNRNLSGMSGMIDLMYHVGRVFQDKLSQSYDLERGVDRKLRRQIDEKNRHRV